MERYEEAENIFLSLINDNLIFKIKKDYNIHVWFNSNHEWMIVKDFNKKCFYFNYCRFWLVLSERSKIKDEIMMKSFLRFTIEKYLDNSHSYSAYYTIHKPYNFGFNH